MQHGVNLPPDIPADELVARLASRDMPSRVIDFPYREGAGNTSGQLRIIILMAMDKTMAKGEAGRITREQLRLDLKREPTAEDMSTDYARDMLNDVLAACLICRFARSRDPIGATGEERRTTYGRIFRSPEWVLNHLSSDEIAILMLEYQILEVEDGPREQVLVDDPFILQMWIDKLKRGAWALGPFASCAFLDLAELTRFALRRIEEAQSLGCRILDPQFMNSLSSSMSASETSEPDTTSSGSSPENSAPIPTPDLPETITVAEAQKRARKLRAKL